ncbi:MAG TPA: hypothetical protein VNM90_19245 [Haliangium sp.]|nr:hypothetical protein [Haliangium sp.]
MVALVSGCGGPSSEAKKPTQQVAAPADGEVPAQAQEPAANITPQDAPDSLLCMMVATHPVGQLRSLAELVDAVQPGAGAAVEVGMIFEQITSDWGGLPAAAFDLEKPLYLLMLDPQASSPMVLVAAVADREAIAAALPETATMRVHRGYAAIGAPQVIDEVAGYALTRLHDEPLPPALTFVLRLEQIMKRYGDAFTASLGMISASMPDPSGQKLVEAYVSLLQAMMQQSRSMRIALEPGAAGLTVHMVLDALPDTTMAAFAQAQSPSDYALVRETATGQDDFFMGGRLDYTTIPHVFDQLWAAMLAATPDQSATTAALNDSMRRWLDLFRDEFAMSGRYDDKERASMRLRARIDDAAKAQALVKEWYELIKRTPAAFKYRKPRVQTVRVQGTQVQVLTAEFAGATPEEQELMEKIYGPKLVSATAVTQDRVSMTIGQNAQRDIREVMAAKPAADEHPAVADARARGESMMVYIDLANLMARILGKGTPARTPAGVTMGLGFEEATMRWRITVPTPQIHGIMAVSQTP